ncbi:MAG TPA: NAD-dependent epimerase/dehydratase family protein [Oscillatoriaceae cyanobacterium]
MSKFDDVRTALNAQPRKWLVTGVAGFIGSNLAEFLLRHGQTVVGLDNFATGHQRNLADIKALVGAEAWARFRFIEGDVANLEDCRNACEGVDYVLHQAALGSVPRSIKDPIASHTANVDGFLHMLVAARDAGVKRFVYASSSSVYGDHPALPKIEAETGNCLSPYAVTKAINELYADVFARNYDFGSIGLRYFNVFGRRQDPEGAYAAVIPKWVGHLLAGEGCVINGDGETSRDFCYIENVVQVNVLAATTENPEAVNQVYNVAYGDRTTLNEIYGLIRDGLARNVPAIANASPTYGPFRDGDIRHSLADTAKARELLGYAPTHSVREGLAEALAWYVDNLGAKLPTS